MMVLKAEELNTLNQHAAVVAAMEQVKLCVEPLAEVPQQQEQGHAGEQAANAQGAATQAKEETTAPSDMQIDQQAAAEVQTQARGLQRAGSGGSQPEEERRLSSVDKRTAADYCPMSNLEALVAACELAAEREGLDGTTNLFYHQEVVGESPGASNKSCGTAARVQSLPVAISTSPRVHHGPPPPTRAHAHAHAPSPTQAKAACSGSPGVVSDAVPLERRPSGGEDFGAGAMAFTLGPDGLPKYRRHKSKVFIRPNKVVYLPTTFMEENFDPASLPLNCEMVVEADGVMVQGEKHHVTIKAVPRQGLSTMFCMTNVMKFQQQYLNWQILNWTKVDNYHIKIHLQGPNSPPPPMLSAASGSPSGCDAGSPRASRPVTASVFAPTTARHQAPLPAAQRVRRSEPQVAPAPCEEGDGSAMDASPAPARRASADYDGARGARGSAGVRSGAPRHEVGAQQLLHALSAELGLGLPASGPGSAPGAVGAQPPASPTGVGLHKRKNVFPAGAAAAAAPGEAEGTWSAAARMVGATLGAHHWTPLTDARGPHLTAHARVPAPAHGMSMAGGAHGLYYVVNQQANGGAAAAPAGQAVPQGAAPKAAPPPPAGEVHLIPRHVAHHGLHGPQLTPHLGGAALPGSNGAVTISTGAPGGPRCIVTHGAPHVMADGGIGVVRWPGPTTQAATGSLFAAGGRSRPHTQPVDGHGQGAPNTAEPRMVGPSSGSGISTGGGSDGHATSGRSSSYGQGGLLELDTPAAAKHTAGSTQAHAAASPRQNSPPPANNGTQQQSEGTAAAAQTDPSAPASAFKRYKSNLPAAVTGNPANTPTSAAAPAHGQPMMPVMCPPWASGLFMPGLASAMAPFLNMHASGAAAGAGHNTSAGAGAQATPMDVAAAAARASANASSCLLALLAGGLNPMHMANAAHNPALASLLRYVSAPAPLAGGPVQQVVGGSDAVMAQYMGSSEAHSHAAAAGAFRG